MNYCSCFSVVFRLVWIMGSVLVIMRLLRVVMNIGRDVVSRVIVIWLCERWVLGEVRVMRVFVSID